VNAYQSRLLSWPVYFWYRNGGSRPSQGVPSDCRYHSVTRCVPSGLCDGIITTTVLSSTSRMAGLSPLASAYAVSIAVCVAATSVEWMPWLMATMVLPFSISRAASSSGSPRGSARRRFARRISSRWAMLASEVMTATRNGRSSVVRPTSSTLTRSEAASSRRK